MTIEYHITYMYLNMQGYSLKAIDIATEYYSKTIKCSEDIFIVEKNFFDICFWARESCREMFDANPARQDLVRKIDDIGCEVDKYMFKVRFKMLNSAVKGKKSLSKSLGSSKKTIKWFIERWINIFMNISTNPSYKAYIDVGIIGLELDENMSHNEDALTLILKEEEDLEYEKQHQKEIEKWDKKLIKMVENGQIGGESTESGGTQMILIF